MDTTTRKQLLAAHLGCSPTDIYESNSGIEHTFRFEDSDYLIVLDYEAEQEIIAQVITYMDQFDAPFLQRHLKTEIDLDLLELYLYYGNCKCCRQLMFELIPNDLQFIDNVVATYGRGHILAWYDGIEHTVSLNDRTYCYIYRMSGPRCGNCT